MHNSENPNKIRIEIEQTADMFKLLAEKEFIKIQVNEALDELESLRTDSNVDQHTIAILEELVGVTTELLDCIEDIDEDYSDEIDRLA